MIARIRKSMNDKDQGFTLIELLVVMIIIGILAAIAIPVFLNQRKKAVDTAAKADVSTIGKEIATYYVDGGMTTEPTLAVASARYTIKYPAAATATDIGKVSDGMGLPAFSVSDATKKSTTWCVTLPYAGGTSTQVYYSAANGLSLTGC